MRPGNAASVRRPEDAHEAGQHDPVGAGGGQRIGHRRIPCVAIGVDGRIDQRRRNALVSGEAERVARPVGQNQPDRAAKQPALLVAAQRAKVRPLPRDEHRDRAAHAST